MIQTKAKAESGGDFSLAQPKINHHSHLSHWIWGSVFLVKCLYF